MTTVLDQLQNISRDLDAAIRDKTAALVRIQREHIRALHARIDVGRTIVATERTLAGVSI